MEHGIIFFVLVLSMTTIFGQKFLAQHKVEASNSTGANSSTNSTTVPTKPPILTSSETEVENYLQKIGPQFLNRCLAQAKAIWERDTNFTNVDNRERYAEKVVEMNNLMLEAKRQFAKYPWKTFKNENIRSHVEAFFNSVPVMNPEKSKRLIELVQSIALEKVKLQSEIEEKTNKDEEENANDDGDVGSPALSLKEYFNKQFKKNRQDWKALYGDLGKQAKPKFQEFMQLLKEELEVRDTFRNEEDKFLDQVKDNLKTIESLWKELKGFYEEFHAHIRGNLMNMYGPKFVSTEYPIPINAVAAFQSWGAVYDDTIPYNNYPSTDDVTAKLAQRNFTTERIYKLVEEYFNSMGFPILSETFWAESIFELPDDGTKVMCSDSPVHPFCYQNESKMIECDGVSIDSMLKAYSALGTAKLYQMTKKMKYLPLVELDEVVIDAFSGVWELIGSSSKRLQAIGLLEKFKSGSSSATSLKLNFEHLQAFILPGMANIVAEQEVFWDIFDGKIPPTDYNCEYWRMRYNIEGVRPPIVAKSKHFEAISLFDSGNQRKSAKFISQVLTFQFHKALCTLAGQYNHSDVPTTTVPTTGKNKNKAAKQPKNNLLRNCDLSGRKEIGPTIKKLLDSGAGKDWKLALKFLTGNDVLDTSAMLEYFEPYHNWLKQSNKKHDFKVGWKLFQSKNSTSGIC